MQRRELFPILSAAALQAQTPYTPKFFTPAEAYAVTRLGEIIMPGSQAAGIIRYVDLVLKYAEDPQQQSWRRGIADVEAHAQKTFAQPFAKLTTDQQDRVVAAMAENEGRRTDGLGRFFIPLKQLVVEAYHYSAANWRDNMHRGTHVALAGFSGCTHKNHS